MRGRLRSPGIRESLPEKEEHGQLCGEDLSGNITLLHYCTSERRLIKEEGDAESIARGIGEAVRDEVDTSYEGWKENPQALREIRQVIIQTIVKDLERPGLYHAEGFVDAVRDYLIENMGIQNA